MSPWLIGRFDASARPIAELPGCHSPVGLRLAIVIEAPKNFSTSSCAAADTRLAWFMSTAGVLTSALTVSVYSASSAARTSVSYLPPTS